MSSRKAVRHAKRLVKAAPGWLYPHLDPEFTPGDSKNLYWHLTNRQLKKMLGNRGLQRPLQFHRHTYIQLLKAADTRYRFRLMDLPPEIRNMINGYVTEGPKGWICAIPRICYVSRKLRDETLAMHLAKHIPLFWITNNHTSSRDDVEETCHLETWYRCKLDRLSDESAAAMTSFTIKIPECRHTDESHAVKITLDKHSSSQLDAKPRIVGYKTTVDHSYSADECTCVDPPMADFLTRDLVPLLDAVVGRDDAMLCKQDLCDFLAVFEGPCHAAPVDGGDV